ncbi:probable potassium transport protein 1 [Rhynchosporium agropyri]|uniref:Potassium transport protein n=1 Tax=Rhynchosporium agropyri TaxID=914238 RepID=A0A1E1L628_9HELO|nr:probable potassium transport protein 1 [Rhynchosporium agropyri]
MYSILLDFWGHVKSLKPAFFSRKPHFNFITVHYFWIIGMAILGSLCLYIRADLDYIDALFLASGAATQSGLNTVDINLLNTWQQMVVYVVPMITNPITINSFVVFLRLYWFEKRFQHIARESTKNRRSISKTLTKARTNERDIGEEERGVNGRSIVVMHGSTRPNGMTNKDALPEDFNNQLEKDRALAEERVRSSQSSQGTSKGHSSDTGDERLDTVEDHLRPNQIKFAEQVKRSDGLADQPTRMPAQRSNEDHIAFLERQRNQDEGKVLRIPGPRDADAGIAPITVDEQDPLSQIMSRRQSGFSGHLPRHEQISTAELNENDNEDDHETQPVRRNITIAEPIRAPVHERVVDDAQAAKSTLKSLRWRRPRFLGGEKDKNHIPHARRTATFQTIKSALSRDNDETMPYLSWEPTVGRNSAFVDLTEDQREELGGIEYRSLKALAMILTAYFVGFSIFGVLSLTPWIYRNSSFGDIVRNDGQGRAWWGIFTANSAFTDLGFTLTPDSMISFQRAQWPLVVLSFLIIIGNTGFPIMLRIIIWVTSKYVPKSSGMWEELKFLLDHPRRCFTLLFPSKATWVLFWILVVLNGLDLLFFIILDLGNAVVTDLPTNIRVLDGWFQAVSTRTAGFGVVNLAALHPAIQVSYLIMMYISVLPIAISVRRTNVYEEKSLGIYGSPADEDADEDEPSYIGAHLRRQLSFDLWYIFLGFFIITISEGKRIQSGDPAFTMFTVLFEIVSAYGTVGLSLGYTNINASFSAEFGVIAKLVIIAMQVRGRHRGLPYELDRAILLPSEHLQKKEADDAALRVRRRSSFGTVGGVVSSGALKTSKSMERTASNFIGNILHPGPTIPNSHCKASHAPDTNIWSRRGSTASAGRWSRATRSISPSLNNNHSAPFDGLTEKRGRPEGRRSFFQEGVNPPPTSEGPPATATSSKNV